MSHLLPGDKLEEQLPKLLPAVLGLYKKHAEAFHVSKVPWLILRDPSDGPLAVGREIRDWAVKDGSLGSPVRPHSWCLFPAPSRAWARSSRQP